MSNLKHYDNLGTARFLTFSCHRRQKLFNDEKVNAIFIRNLDRIRKKYDFKLLGYVLMPNHVHLVIYPRESLKIGKVIGELKSLSARDILRYYKNIGNSVLKELVVRRDGIQRYAFWQRRCYDHNCRGQSAVLEKLNYCHNNPINKKLVIKQSDWIWSSYNWYYGSGDSLITIDDFEMNYPTASGGAPQIRETVLEK